MKEMSLVGVEDVVGIASGIVGVANGFYGVLGPDYISMLFKKQIEYKLINKQIRK